MSKVNLIGEVSRLGNEKIKIVEFEGERYFCKNIETFSADPAQRIGQRIERVIDRVIFYTRGYINVYAYTDAEKQTLASIREADPDPMLLEIVKMCHGADDSDLEKFKFCESVTEFRELTELDSNLSAGLGFPGKGFGLVVARFGYPLHDTQIFLQVVHSYYEGYSVEHQQLTPELFAFAHLDEIKQRFNAY